mgnify:CR=1 FL=1
MGACHPNLRERTFWYALACNAIVTQAMNAPRGQAFILVTFVIVLLPGLLPRQSLELLVDPAIPLLELLQRQRGLRRRLLLRLAREEERLQAGGPREAGRGEIPGEPRRSDRGSLPDTAAAGRTRPPKDLRDLSDLRTGALCFSRTEGKI